MSGIDNVQVDDEYVYCFSQYFQAVNVYDKEGEFQFSITVPDGVNGKGYMYLWEGYICIKNNNPGDVYQYQNVKYVCRVCYNEDGEPVSVFDKNDQIIKTDNIKDEIIGYTDNEIVSVDLYDSTFESNLSVVDEQGDLYATELLRPRLTKNGQTIVKGSMLKILCSSPVLTFVYFVLSEILYILFKKHMKL